MPENVFAYGPFLAPLVLITLVLLLYGTGERARDIVFALVAAVVAIVAGTIAWYAWAESRSWAWACGYALLSVAAVAASVRWGRRAIKS